MSGEDTVSFIDADFCSHINAVLSLPELNQPGTAVIVKINRLAVKDDVKVRSTFVVQAAISIVPLPCGQTGSKHIL